MSFRKQSGEQKVLEVLQLHQAIGLLLKDLRNILRYIKVSCKVKIRFVG